MSDKPVSLDAIRQEIDSIDDAIHDLIMRRADLAEEVRQAKQGEDGPGVTYLRPGREARVLRRLIARHKGYFPKRVLIRLWREIFSVSLSMQNEITLAVWTPERGAGYLDLAHNQYGSFTSASVHQSVVQVITEVAEGRATLGILPVPKSGDTTAWWPPLMSQRPGTPRVIARLPMTGSQGALEALVIAVMPPDIDDSTERSLLAVEYSRDISRSALLEALQNADIRIIDVVDKRNQPPASSALLLEVEGAFESEDKRLDTLKARCSSGQSPVVIDAVVIGSYAQPFTEAELDSPDEP